MSVSIDEMIKAGKTLPEIQAELRKIVAARDEDALVKAKAEKAKSEARQGVISALKNYLKVLGINPDEIEGLDETMFVDLERAIKPLVAPPPSKNKNDHMEDELAWLREFIASL